MKNHIMAYTMPPDENLTGKLTSTLELCERGIRTATTRSYPLGRVGEVITFNNRPQKYRITRVVQLNERNTSDPVWIEEWSRKEQWTVAHFYKVFGGKTVHIGSWQTEFERIKEPIQNRLI